jgi:ribosome-binding factor A
MTDRMDRVAEAIKREISVILQDEINDPRVRHVTITRVEVTRDLALAKVFYLISAGENERGDIMKGLKSASSFIRSELAKKTSMKFTPRISFREDKAKKEEEAVENIFKKIEKEHPGTAD